LTQSNVLVRDGIVELDALEGQMRKECGQKLLVQLGTDIVLERLGRPVE